MSGGDGDERAGVSCLDKDMILQGANDGESVSFFESGVLSLRSG